MPRIVSTLEFVPGTKDRIWQMMTRVWEQMARVVNGGLSFGTAYYLTSTPDRKFSDNIDAVWIELTITLTMAQQEFMITHNLGRPLNAYIVARCSSPIILYDGSGNTTNTAPNQVYFLGAYSPFGFPITVVLLLF